MCSSTFASIGSVGLRLKSIFLVLLEGKRESIAGGGRYDKVVGKYLGREISAVGISFGLERLTEIARITPNPIPKVLVISIDKEKESIKLTKKLRKAEVFSSISFEKVGKALEYANSLQIPYVIFIGKNEIENKKFKLKNMTSGEEKELTEKQLIKKFSN